MQSDIKFLQELSEDELCELVILPLLEAIGYKEIRYLHGSLELGKDIICKKNDVIEGDLYSAFVVKSKKVTGDVSSNRSLREIIYQIEQSITSPFIDPFNGLEVRIQKAHFVTPFQISQQSIISIKDVLKQFLNNISFIDGVKLLSLISKNIPDLLESIPNPEMRYIQILFTRFSKNVVISRLGSTKGFSLNDIYIATQLSKTNINDAKYITLGNPEIEEGNYVDEIVQDHKHLVILADAGSGKSTLMHSTIIKLSHKYKESKGNGIIPIFIELSKIPIKNIETLIDFKNWISSCIVDEYGFEDFSWGNCANYFLLLDGFDEVRNKHFELQSYISSLSNIFPNGIILTSRPSRIPELCNDFVYYKLNPFSNTDILKFLTIWHSGNDIKIQDLYKFIINDKILLNFCRTPLLLTLFSILSSNDSISNLPNTKTDIYNNIVELLIDKWDTIKEIKSEFTPYKKHFILEKIAYYLHNQGNKSIGYEEISKIGSKHLDDEPENINNLLDELIYRSSLIRRVDSNNYGFVHLSFQEFFTAKHLVRFQENTKINSVIFNQWWINTLKFYFGLIKSLDSIRIIERKCNDFGHLLVEYLHESIFTSTERKEFILEIFGKQLLVSNSYERNAINVFIDNHKIIIPKLIKLLNRSLNTHFNYKFLHLITLLDSDGIKYINLVKYEIQTVHIPEIQSFLIKHIIENETALDLYLKSFKIIEDSCKNNRLNEEQWLFISNNISTQHQNISNLNIEKKTKLMILEIIKRHRENIRTIKKNAM